MHNIYIYIYIYILIVISIQGENKQTQVSRYVGQWGNLVLGGSTHVKKLLPAWQSTENLPPKSQIQSTYIHLAAWPPNKITELVMLTMS